MAQLLAWPGAPRMKRFFRVSRAIAMHSTNSSRSATWVLTSAITASISSRNICIISLRRQEIVTRHIITGFRSVAGRVTCWRRSRSGLMTAIFLNAAAMSSTLSLIPWASSLAIWEVISRTSLMAASPSSEKEPSTSPATASLDAISFMALACMVSA